MPLSAIEKLTAVVAVLIVGVLILIYGGRDTASMIIGAAFTVLGGIGSYLQLKIVLRPENTKQIVKDSQVSDSAIVGKARDVHIYHNAPTEKREAQPPPPYHEDAGEKNKVKGGETKDAETEPFWEVDEDVVLAYDEYKEYPLELDEGDVLVGQFEADGKISVYLLGPSSLKSFRASQGVNPYWSTIDVKRTTLRFIVSETRQYTLVVSNENEDNEDDEELTVSVRFRVESSELDF